ncbi:MAG: hypothetical protein K0R36_1447 [Chryseobacterium sp.]|jgi:hypothetical protein|nr:hypothetical protein [Chryseobacterium sp.]
MNYEEALSRVEKLQKYADEYQHDAKYIIVPAAKEEMEKYLNDYRNISDRSNLLNCTEYCSDGNFLVYRIDISSGQKKNKKTSVHRNKD